MPEPRASKRRVLASLHFCHRSNIITHDEPRCMNDMTPTRACSGACAGCVTLSASRAPRPPGRPPHFRRWTPNELPAVVASHARHRRRDRHRAAERHAGRRAGTAGHGARGHLRQRHGLRRRAAGPGAGTRRLDRRHHRALHPGRTAVLASSRAAPARLRTAARQAPPMPATGVACCSSPVSWSALSPRRPPASAWACWAPSRCCAASASRRAT